MDCGLWKDGEKKRRRRYRHILSGSEFLSAPAKGPAVQKMSGKAAGGETAEGYESVIRDVTSFVLAPAMNDFVLWVLGSAVKKGQKRLYFLARDGYFMYKTALEYCERLNLPVDCRYLSCSRYSVRVPMYHLNMDEALDYICRGGIDVTFDKVLGRTGLDESIKDDLGKDLTGKWGSMGVIPYSKLGDLKKDLKKDMSFMKAVEENSRKRFPLLKEYLEQEGLLDDIFYAFADSGWTGSMQKVLSRLVDRIKQGEHPASEQEDPKTLSGYYWGLYELPGDVDRKDYHCYYFGPETGMRRKAGFSNCLFEGIFSAPHGMTLGYEKKSGKKAGKRTAEGIAPVYAQIRDDNLEFNRMTERYLSAYTGRLCDIVKNKMTETEKEDRNRGRIFLRALSQLRSGRQQECRSGRCCQFLSRGKKCDCRSCKNNSTADREVIGRLMEVFMSTPTRNEVQVYGALPFSDDVLDENEQQMAALLTEEELRSNHPWRKAVIMLGLSNDKLKESAWYEGSAVRGGKNVCRHLLAYRIYKMMVYAKKEAVRLKNKYS